MRLFLAFLGTVSLVIGGAAFYLGLQRGGEDRNQSAIRQALKSQVKAVASETEQEFAERARQVEAILAAGAEKRARAKGLMEQAGAPAFLLAKREGELREFSPKRGVTEEAKAAAFAFFGKEARLGFWESADKIQYILFRGAALEQEYVALYRQDSLFTKLRGSAAIRPWVVQKDGTVLYHATTRHTGVNSSSVRPVAQGAESLSRGQRVEMLASYVGLDGQELLGAWIALPVWGVVVGSEWPALAAANAGISWFTWIAIAAFLLGAFLLGACVNPRPIHVTAAQREIKDLSHEARAFIKKAERQAEKALDFARDREQQCADLEAKAREQLAYAERIRWTFERTESFLEEAVEAKDEHQVWSILAQYLSSMALRFPTLVYTYSASSCSLIPQAQAGVDKLPESARRYLADARLLIGDLQALGRLETTSAYEQWRTRFERFFPLTGQNISVLPFASPTGSRGVVLFLMTDGVMPGGDSEKQRELWALFAYRAAWLYDMKKRLLQSRHAAKRSDKLAGPSDRTRDRSPAT